MPDGRAWRLRARQVARGAVAPPNAGSKQVPEGAADCLKGRVFVITGLQDSLTKEEMTDLCKR